MVQWLQSNRRRHRGYGEMDAFWIVSCIRSTYFFCIVIVIVYSVQCPYCPSASLRSSNLLLVT